MNKSPLFFYIKNMLLTKVSEMDSDIFEALKRDNKTKEFELPFMQ